MSNADDMFAAARALGEQIAAQRAAHRTALKERRNARRRARYAATAKPKPTVKPAAAVEDDYDLSDAGCRCHIVPMPPCGWCESGGERVDIEAAS